MIGIAIGAFLAGLFLGVIGMALLQAGDDDNDNFNNGGKMA